MKIRRAALLLCLSVFPSLARAAFVPGPIQVNDGLGVAKAVGWQVGGSTVPSHEVGTANVSVQGTPSVTLANQVPLAVAVSTLPNVTIQGSGGAVPQVWVSSMPQTTVVGTGGPVPQVWVSSLPAHPVTQGGQVPWGVAVSTLPNVTIQGSGGLVPQVWVSSMPQTTVVGTGGPVPQVWVSSLPAHPVTQGGQVPWGVAVSTLPNVTIQGSGGLVPQVWMSSTPAVNVSSPGVNGSVSAGGEVSIVYIGTQPYTLRTSTVNASASGFNTVVSTVAGRYIVVVGWDLTVSGAVNFKWQTAGSPGVDLTGLYYGAAAGNGVARECVRYCFQTKQGEALFLNLSGATAVGGLVQYILYP